MNTSEEKDSIMIQTNLSMPKSNLKLSEALLHNQKFNTDQAIQLRQLKISKDLI